MIKAVQKNARELPKANDVPNKSDDLTLDNRDGSTTTEDDDDCVYVSPEETENGIWSLINWYKKFEFSILFVVYL